MIFLDLHPPHLCHSTPESTSSSIPKPKPLSKPQLRIHKPTKSRTPKTAALTFAKPSPTPLLIHNRRFSSASTKLDALEAVVSDLEAAIANGVTFGPEIYASLLETCYRMHAVDHGVRIHRLIPPTLLRKNQGVSSKLVRLYAVHGLVDNAHNVFDKMPKRCLSAFPWNSLISGYVEMAQYEDAIALYFQMDEEGIQPDRHTFPRVLKACAGLGSIQVGEAVHRDAARLGFGNDVFILNSLVDMYAKCGDIVRARKVFDKIPNKDLVSWNSMITGYTRHDLLVESLETLRAMLLNGTQPDSIAISTILTSTSSLKLGLEIHTWVLRRGLVWNMSIANSLIAVYSKSNMLRKAQWLFENMPDRDVVSWNSIISAHSKSEEALRYYGQMERLEKIGIVPDTITFVSVLSACANLGKVEEGERFFTWMKKKYKINPSMEHYSCMVNLYGRAGMVEKAYRFVVETMAVEAGPTVWGGLLNAAYLHGKVGIGEIAAAKLFELEPDNEHNFEVLIKLYECVGRLDGVEKVRGTAAQRGLELYVDY